MNTEPLDEDTVHVSEAVRGFLESVRARRMDRKPFYNNGVNYHKYIKSPAWAARRKAFRGDRDRCERCNITGIGSWRIMGFGLEVHHKTYEHLGAELDEDLELLCNRCHAKETNGEWSERLVNWWARWGYTEEGLTVVRDEDGEDDDSEDEDDPEDDEDVE